jgi:hypothetical protein
VAVRISSSALCALTAWLNYPWLKPPVNLLPCILGKHMHATRIFFVVPGHVLIVDAFSDEKDPVTRRLAQPETNNCASILVSHPIRRYFTSLDQNTRATEAKLHGIKLTSPHRD